MAFLLGRIFGWLLLFDQVLVDEYVPLKGVVGELKLLKDCDEQHDRADEPVDNWPDGVKEVRDEPERRLVASELDQEEHCDDLVDVLLREPVGQLDDAHDGYASRQDLRSIQIVEEVLLNIVHEGILILWLSVFCDADYDASVNPV